MVYFGKIEKSIFLKKACLFKKLQLDNEKFFFHLKIFNLYERNPAKKELGIFCEFIGNICQPDPIFLLVELLH